MTKKEKIKLQAWFSKSGYSGPNMYYLEDGQIVEFTDPIFNSSLNNVEFKINGSDNQKIWFSQLDVIIVHINDDGNVTSIELPEFPVKGSMKEIIKIEAKDFVEIVKNKKYRVNCYQSFILNKKSKTAQERNIEDVVELTRYIVNCINENRVDDLGDTLKMANTYNFIEI